MPNHPLTATVRKEVRELIAEAVAEPDILRRQALLATADHWLAILKERVQMAALQSVGRRSDCSPVSGD